MIELIDREAVLEFIKSYRHSTDVAFDMEKHLDEIPTASPWHRVEERLPDDTRDVLAVRRYGNDLEKQEVIVAHLSVIMDMKRGFDKWWNATNITHWMPFPEPPKEDA